MKSKHIQTNALQLYRLRRGLSQKRAASLIGQRSGSMLSRYENGRALPDLRFALKLEILYRVPVAFLFPDLYVRLRDSIRLAESKRLTASRSSRVPN